MLKLIRILVNNKIYWLTMWPFSRWIQIAGYTDVWLKTRQLDTVDVKDLTLTFHEMESEN